MKDVVFLEKLELIVGLIWYVVSRLYICVRVNYCMLNCNYILGSKKFDVYGFEYREFSYSILLFFSLCFWYG